MPIFFCNATIIEVWGSLKVIKGKLRFMRGYMIQNRKKLVKYDVLDCLVFFLYTSCICSKVLRSSEVVIEGQPEVSHLTSNWLRDILFVLAAVFSFHFICKMAIFIQVILKF